MSRASLNIRIDQELMDKIKDKADSQNRTPSNFVETVLKKYFDENK